MDEPNQWVRTTGWAGRLIYPSVHYAWSFLIHINPGSGTVTLFLKHRIQPWSFTTPSSVKVEYETHKSLPINNYVLT